MCGTSQIKFGHEQAMKVQIFSATSWCQLWKYEVLKSSSLNSSNLNSQLKSLNFQTF
jgi:hypothetical protein